MGKPIVQDQAQAIRWLRNGYDGMGGEGEEYEAIADWIERGIRLSAADAQAIVDWIEIATDNGQGPPPWDMLNRIKAAYPLLVIPMWLRAPPRRVLTQLTPLPARPRQCPACKCLDGVHEAQCKNAGRMVYLDE